jgi:hypothetical protein
MSSTDEWISEFPSLRNLITNKVISGLLEGCRPARGIKIGDEEWNQMVAHIGPLSIDESDGTWTG